jgi:hypothetical protein
VTPKESHQHGRTEHGIVIAHRSSGAVESGGNMKSFRLVKDPMNGLAAVKVGFSWPASFFGIFSLLRDQLWGLAALCIVATILLTDAKEVADLQYLRPWLIAVGLVAISFASSSKATSGERQI